MEHSSESDEQTPQFVIQPLDEDDYEDDKPKNVVHPLTRYFSWTNIICIIVSLLVTGLVIFELQLTSLFWKFYAPEETTDYSVNLKSCKIPSLYDGQSELPFMWELDNSRSGSLGRLDFECSSVDKFSDVGDDGKLHLLGKMRKRKCCYRNITRPESMESDMYTVQSNCRDVSSNKTDVSNSEFLLVQCIHTRNKSVDFNTHALLPIKPTVVDKVLYWGSKYDKVEQLPYNVAVIVIASTSRAHAYRSLPETMKYLEGVDVQFTTMNGYQSMEENVPAVSVASNNILPLVAGIADPSIVKWTLRWDNYSMLWSKFADKKYVTMFMDDSKKMLRTSHGNANGNGKHKAFKKQPTDYYLKPFLEAHSEATDALFTNRIVAKRYCIGKKTTTAYLLRHLVRFHEKFEVTPTFSFSYLSWPQQQYGLKALAKMDATYLAFFKNFFSLTHVLERTAVIIMSDHGGISHPYFKTEHGALEKLNPLLMIRLPQNMMNTHPKYVKNLKANAHRIIGPLDIHRTISIFPDIFTEKYDKESNESAKVSYAFPIDKVKQLGRNIFVSELPYNRSCGEALIPKEMCLCNKGKPSNYHGRSIVTQDGTPERYWHYTSIWN